MTTAYVLGLICILGYVQGGLVDSQPAIIEDLRQAEPSWASSRIVSGEQAVDGQFPHQISLRMVNEAGGVSSCGGSIIHHEWVITAAHCLANRITFVVRLGLTNLTRPEYIVETPHKFIHPRYNEIAAGVQTDDLALLKLDHQIPYGPYIQPCRLQSSADKNRNYDGVTMVVSGYGRTNDLWNGGVASEVLLWVRQRGITNEECLAWYPNSQVIKEQTICVQYYDEVTQSSCQGDSGGPLIITEEDELPTMVGVVSFGSTAGCSAPNPSGYVRPGHYHDWYLEVTGINFDTSAPEEASNKVIIVDSADI